MKKRAFCLLLILMLSVLSPAQATGGFLVRLQYGALSRYENRVFGYSLGVFSKFYMLSDDQLLQIWQDVEASADEDDDALYDLRYWISPDSRYIFSIQVKEPTYDSFETEVAKAPEYAEYVADQYTPEQQLTQLHDGILRDTSAGQMLETAISYIDFAEDGSEHTITFLYYDYYGEGVEYIFAMESADGYDGAQSLLDQMMQTVQFIPQSIAV